MQIFILSSSGRTLCALSSNNDSLDTFNFYDSTFKMNLLTPDTFEFSCSMSHKNSKYIEVGNQVIFKYRNEYHLFKITEVEVSHSDTHTANCYCEGASLELINSVVMPSSMPQATAQQCLNTILTNTDWQVGDVDDFETKDINFSNYGTVLTEIQNSATLFEAELKYRVEFSSSSGITGKYIDFKKNIGKVSGVRFEYGVNTTDVTKKVNSDNVCTAVIPVGKDDLTITAIECTKSAHGFDKAKGVAYVSISEEERSQLTSSPYHIFSTFNYETSDPYTLAVKAWEHLQDNKVPKIDYTFNPVKLGDDVYVGDEVYCIDREMNIQMMATVSEFSINFNDSSNNSVTLTNYVEAISNIDFELVAQIQSQLKDLELDSNVIISGTQPDVDKKPIIWVDTSKNTDISINTWTGEEWITDIDSENFGEIISEYDNTIKNWITANSEMKVYYQAIAPIDVVDGQLWIDTSGTPYVWKRWDATSGTWIKVITTEANEIGAYSKVEVDQMIDEVTGEISSKVSQTDLDKAIADNEIKGRNLLLETGTPIEVAGENYVNQCTEDYMLSDYAKGIVYNGCTITFSFDYIAETGATGTICPQMNQTPWYHFSEQITVDSTNLSGHNSVSFACGEDVDTGSWDGVEFRLDNFTGNIKFYNVKLEVGTETDWTRAPEDYDIRLTQAESKITQNAYAITSKVSKTDYDIDIDSMNSRLESAESTIEQTAEAITSTVKKGEIISSINQTAETIKIDASKIEFDGVVTFSNLDSSLQSQVTAGANAGTNASTALSTVQGWCSANNTTMIDGAKIYTGSIEASKISGGTLSGVTINVDTDMNIGEVLNLGGGIYSTTTAKVIRMNGADTAISTSGSGLVIDTGGNLTLRASGGTITLNPRPSSSTAGDIVLNGSYLENFWVRGTVNGTAYSVSNSEIVDAVKNGGGSLPSNVLTTSNYTSYCATASHNHSGTYAPYSHTHSGYASSSHTHSYLPLSGGSMSGTITSLGITPKYDSSYDLGSGSSYFATCRADQFYGVYSPPSDRRLKENIQDIDVEKCVKLINGLDIKTFNYIKTGKPKMGVIAQDLIMQDHYETEDYFTDMIVGCDTGDDNLPLAIDYDQFTMALVVTVQEQQKQIDSLQAQLDELKSTINNLLG